MEPNKFPASMEPDGNHIHKAYPLILRWYSSLHFVPSHFISITVILILSYHLYLGLTSNTLSLGVSNQKFSTHLLSNPNNNLCALQGQFQFLSSKANFSRIHLKINPLTESTILSVLIFWNTLHFHSTTCKIITPHHYLQTLLLVITKSPISWSLQLLCTLQPLKWYASGTLPNGHRWEM